jgi:hypothetical protein
VIPKNTRQVYASEEYIDDAIATKNDITVGIKIRNGIVQKPRILKTLALMTLEIRAAQNTVSGI